jgi:hypothetical protein
MGESVPWNALEVVGINHKSYLQHVTTSHTPRQSLKMYFEGELRTLQKFMEPRDLVEPTPLSSSSNYEDTMYSSTHIPPTHGRPMMYSTYNSCNMGSNAKIFFQFKL